IVISLCILIQAKRVHRFDDDFSVFGLDDKSPRGLPFVCYRQLNLLVYVPLEEPGAVCRAEPFFGQKIDRRVREFDHFALPFHPRPSVIHPSSNAWRKRFMRYGEAFSTSSSSKTVYGSSRSCSVKIPPRSDPTIPRGIPISFSIPTVPSAYSLMSMRIILCSSPNINSATAFASSVFPTPVGPRNKSTPSGA